MAVNWEFYGILNAPGDPGAFELAARDTRLRGSFVLLKGGWHCSNGITAAGDLRGANGTGLLKVIFWNAVGVFVSCRRVNFIAD